ncbi:hypothetical protein [Novosphingobium sp. Leaf2]|uniref:hypothetical protein n=1 Tax=Novosphingobium sp. Leaf2 TaxID=1735670 RepID=UPI000A4B0668|nr:hypothetical protein [Novosphingobium sp. Leaf2]
MSTPVLTARADYAGLAARLATRAATLAVAHATVRLLAARGDDRRWRRAGLVWPLFAKG